MRAPAAIGGRAHHDGRLALAKRYPLRAIAGAIAQIGADNQRLGVQRARALKIEAGGWLPPAILVVSRPFVAAQGFSGASSCSNICNCAPGMMVEIACL